MAGVEDLADADPLPVVLSWLTTHPAVLAELGPDRVGAYSIPPYPRLRVTDVPGGIENYDTAVVEVRIQIEALGEMDGSKAELRRLLYLALGALKELPRADPPPAGPVIGSVRPAQGGGFLPEADKRPRYVARATVRCRPRWSAESV
ncbi:hypothetical protein AB0F17_43400 [Nonomuraea sp. NPDC026600]|uniref:hypothetical protein n=1 Tax=Nonomuraea sp. NPDC026600 TaxID=3155363 RepID=UPI0033EB88C8